MRASQAQPTATTTSPQRADGAAAVSIWDKPRRNRQASGGAPPPPPPATLTRAASAQALSGRTTTEPPSRSSSLDLDLDQNYQPPQPSRTPPPPPITPTPTPQPPPVMVPMPPPPPTQPQQQSDQYACPICATPCHTLYQLNAHLDEFHNEAEDEDIGDKIITWFKKTHRSAAKALQNTTQKAQQTLSFDKLDKVFANIGVATGSGASSSAAGSVNGDGYGITGSGFDTPASNYNGSSADPIRERASSPSMAQEPLTEDSVTRRHWQTPASSSICAHPGCGKTLTPFALKVGAIAQAGTGRQNCRRCGRLYCDAHVGLQMRLAVEDARHDVNGVWCRVCEDCFTSREGYRDTHGVSRNRTNSFLRFRKAGIDRVLLDETKLLKRLERLSASYAVENAKSKRSSIGSISSLAGIQSGRRHIDTSIVTWEEDSSVTRCPLCNASFSSLMSTINNRRHHCRLCGIVVCGNETCSANFPLIPQSDGTSPGEVRICRTCRSSILRRRERDAASQAPVPVMMQMHQIIAKCKAQIEELLPKFNDLIIDMRGREINTTDREYVLASRYRKTLMDLFAEVERQGKMIEGLPTQSPAAKKLHTSIHAATIQYLQHNMFTLHMMPQTVTEKAAAAAAAASDASPPLRSLADVERLNNAEVALAALELQEEQLRVSVEEAVRRRRLDDVGALKEALSEVVAEVDAMRSVVEGLRRTGGAVVGTGGKGIVRSPSVASVGSARGLVRSPSVASTRRV